MNFLDVVDTTPVNIQRSVNRTLEYNTSARYEST